MEEDLHGVGLFIVAMAWFLLIFDLLSMKVLGCLSNR